MKTLFIVGSPRNGNTELILKKIYEDVTTEKDIVLLREKRVEHCVGDLSCHKTFKCFIKDDMSEIINKMEEADTIVFGIPNYFCNIASICKAFIDRTTPLYRKKSIKGINAFFIYTGGGETEKVNKYMKSSIYGFVKCLKFNVLGDMTFQALHPVDLRNVDLKLDEVVNILNNAQSIESRNGKYDFESYFM